jgi:hypothetical protein
LIALTNDWADHYSAAAMYLGLNGLLPPTAKSEDCLRVIRASHVRYAPN